MTRIGSAAKASSMMFIPVATNSPDKSLILVGGFLSSESDMVESVGVERKKL